MASVKSIYGYLYDSYGTQGWWPLSGLGMPVNKDDKDWPNYLKANPKGNKDDFIKNWPRHLGIAPKSWKQRFEIIVGAILTQNTSWSNVEKAIYTLNKNKLIDAEKIKKVDQKKLGGLIMPAGYFNQKSRKLKECAQFFSKNNDFDREEVLKIWGVGPETADSILLYAFGKPYFVVDAYTKRILGRAGFKEKSYDDIQGLFMANVDDSVDMYKEYHALIVEHGKSVCLKSRPRCGSCPIAEVCKSRDSFK